MKLRLPLLFISIIFFLCFVVYSYTVAKEAWQTIDFDTTVKVQDKVPRKFDDLLSYLSLLGSAEVTFVIAGIFALMSLIRFKILPAIGWLIIIPASIFEVFGKLILFHPGTPVLFHRSVTATQLPSFYIHTNFSYPSGHMTRTTFLVTMCLILVLTSSIGIMKKMLIGGVLVGFSALMAMSRVSLGEHWLSDVIGGSLLGIAAAFFASILVIPIKRKKSPLANTGGAGVIWGHSCPSA